MELITYGIIKISGIAWSGEGNIIMVEVSLDGGRSWVETKRMANNSGYGITHWEYNWKPVAPGNITLLSRAYDSNGGIQPLESRWNKGGYGNNVVHKINLKTE